jgi:hypothetical protein
MKRIAIGIAVLVGSLMSGSVAMSRELQPEEFYLVGRYEHSMEFIYAGTVRKSGEYTTAMTLSVEDKTGYFDDGKAYDYLIVTSEFDCKRGKRRRLTFGYGSLSGEWDYIDDPSPTWNSINPGSHGETVLQIVCGTVPPKRVPIKYTAKQLTIKAREIMATRSSGN